VCRASGVSAVSAPCAGGDPPTSPPPCVGGDPPHPPHGLPQPSRQGCTARGLAAKQPPGGIGKQLVILMAAASVAAACQAAQVGQPTRQAGQPTGQCLAGKGAPAAAAAAHAKPRPPKSNTWPVLPRYCCPSQHVMPGGVHVIRECTGAAHTPTQTSHGVSYCTIATFRGLAMRVTPQEV